MQEDLGLQGVTDGEYRRASWHMDFIYQIGGITKAQDNLKVQFHNENGDIEFTPAAMRVTGKLKLERCIFADDFAFLRSVASGMPKLTIPSPSMVHYRGGRAAIDPERLSRHRGVLARPRDRSMPIKIEALGKLGCTYLQLDDTSLAYLNDPITARIHQGARRRRRASARDLYSPLERRAGKEASRDARLHAHVPRQLQVILGRDWQLRARRRRALQSAERRRVLPRYDDARSGGFEPLRLVPAGKFVVLGLVTTKKGALETKDNLKRRIDEASKFVPIEQLCLSPQCGFSSTVEGNALTIEEEMAKLALIVETAREVWGTLASGCRAIRAHVVSGC